MDNYLIPANTKRGKLIFSIFRPFDIYLFGGGILATFLLLAFLPLTNTLIAIMCLLPALITGFLVVPVPNYHNMLTVIIEAYDFLTNRQKYRWKGWCFKNVGIQKKGK